MKIKTYIGLFFILSTIVLNHVDVIFPTFTEIVIFGNTFSILKGFSSTDIIWTVVQKLNLVFFAFGVLFLFPFDNIKKNFTQLFIIIALVSIIIMNAFLAVAAIHDYIDGFGDGLFRITSFVMIAIVLLIVVIILKLNNVINSHRKEVMQLKSDLDTRVNALRKKEEKLKQFKSMVNSKADSIEAAQHEIIKKVEALEVLPLFISVYDNMDNWTRHSRHKAQKIYFQIDKQLKDLEAIRFE
ncbi:hypothetical protein ACFO3O_09240 [Dokdonia ponticola]|uniref:Uncharacterized protein n=1 Tax=Dokdonia ponticola TaxID=2041041 RepID=A0ABV9HX51_9FLAO